MRVLGFGDNIVDRFIDRGIEYPGGNAVNVAVYMRRLGSHAEYLGVFGDDELATFLRSAIDAQGVSTAHSVVKSGHSGVARLRVVNGERVFAGGNDGGVTVTDPIDLEEDRGEYVRKFDLAHTSVYSRTESVLPELCAAGVLVSYDFSSEPEYRRPEHLDEVAPYLNLALFSCSDLSSEQTWELLDEAIKRGAQLALATRGLNGAMITDGHNRVAGPAREVPEGLSIVDTMGCGDAFLTGCMVSLFESGWNREETPGLKHLKRSLQAGADAAYDQCFVEGAFGGGRAVRESSMTNQE